MKTFRYLLMLAIGCMLATSCMNDGFDEASDDETVTSFGNQNIAETNVVTIAQLKSDYSKYIATDYRDGVSYKQVTDSIQIKGYVVGNDISGNMYQEIALQDSTGGIIIGISDGGLCGYLPLGAEVIVDLKGLYVGNYGKQAQIGIPYTNSSGATSIGRMSRAEWNKHFKLTGEKDSIEPEVFADGGTATTWDLSKDGGKLGIIKNVSFRDITSSTTYANPDAGAGSVSLYFNEYSGRTILMYNSNYADFAADTVAQGKVNITGVIKRYNSSWEIIIRSISDVEEVE